MRRISGIPVSEGIVIGKVLLFQKESQKTEKRILREEEGQEETERFEKAVSATVEQIKQLYKTAKEKLGEEEAEIFAAHLSVAEDPMIAEGVCEKIRGNQVNAEHALEETLEEIGQMFSAMSDEYLRERAADVKDVGKRIMDCLTGNAAVDLSHLPYPCIIAANDLSPSETVTMDFSKTLGFVTESGGRTSHTAILSRALEIPAVVGTGAGFQEIKDGDMVILDARSGDIFIDPQQEHLDLYKKKQEEYQQEKDALMQLKSLPGETLDKHRVELCANIGNPADARRVLPHGAEGIGLYRTEFLYMDNADFPSEEEQFEAYKEVAALMDGRPVIIRTLDIGGDKELPYFEFEKEENPFLGWRAIRICLDRTDVFKTQLRAILRASAFGNLRIMYPMIISVEELKRANELLQECKEELKEEGKEFDAGIMAGIMVETPAAVVMADELAKYADFFSIGTNDLCQYTLAVDRGNVKIADKYNPFHPAVLRNIKHVIDAAHRQGKFVGMCGEFAGDERATVLLLGLGLDEFSMTAVQIPKVKKKIRSLNMGTAEIFAKKALEAETAKEIEELIQQV